MNDAPPIILVLGASGLIGRAIATELIGKGYPVIPVARRFTVAQQADFGQAAVEFPVVTLGAGALAQFLSERQVDIVVNCLGVLQDSVRGRTEDVHRAFVSRLAEALGAQPRPALLVHLSIPGREDDDQTPFSRTKRAAERLIAASSVPFVIVRPGFVIAPAAYGGSALIRALAALPLGLTEREPAGRLP